MSSTAPHELTTDNASIVWEDVSGRIDALIAAWEAGQGIPQLAEFLPERPAALRRMALAELIKVDMEYRYQGGRAPKPLELYAEEFPELAAEGGIPCDLIYEEFHLRRRSGQAVDAEEYCRRYAAQAGELRQLLGLEAPRATTVLLSAARTKDIQVGDQIDDFDLLTQLGKGAFASVYLARQRSMQRLVALKISADHGSEPQTMAQLDHPHIVRVYDQRLVPEQKLRLLYMQLVPGGTLEGVIDTMRALPVSERSGRALLDAVDHALDRRGESPPVESPLRERLGACTWPEVVCWIGVRLATALDYAHRRGVLHRDIKPANVLVSADGSPKLADFNISFSSKLEGSTPAAYFGGSLAYMSPEQLEACNPAHDRSPNELDGRSDLYSLGVLLWELLTAERPWKDEPIKGNWSHTLANMARSRRLGLTAETLRRLPAGLPSGLEQVLAKCLAADVESRYQSGAELARQLELCLQPRTQRLLRPPEGWLRRSMERQPLLAIMAAGLAPNVLISGLNIIYNYDEIIRFLSEPAQKLFSGVQLYIVNAVCYLSAIAVLVVLSAPVLRGVWQVRRGQQLEPERAAMLRRRTLWFGDAVAIVSGAEWLLSAIAFPAWLHTKAASGVGLEHYLHFLASQALCGLLASTLTFFLVTRAMVRVVYPVLLRGQVPQAKELVSLRNLAWRMWLYFGLAVSVPFLGMILLWLIQTQMAAAIGMLSIVGLGGFMMSFFLALAIRSDLEALAGAVSPSSESVGGLGDSFWTMSR